MKSCPHCGASIHEEASFCPCCAQTVNRREEVHPPRHMSRRALYSALLITFTAVLVFALASWANSHPKTYDNGAHELEYSNREGSFYFYIADDLTPDIPLPQVRNVGQLDAFYRYPACLFVNDADSGTPAGEPFWQSVDSIGAEILCADQSVTITCTEPERDSEYTFVPNAVMTFIDFHLLAPGEHEAELVFTVSMKNGDVIRLRQLHQLASTVTRRYTSQDAPMNTIEELQAFINELTASTDENDMIYIDLPPVVYEGGLALEERCIKLTGSRDSDGERTTFTGPIQAACSWGYHEFTNIDFIGGGTGVGITASARTQLANCRVSGWETGYLATGDAWIDADETVFENNTVGMCFDSVGATVLDQLYGDNVFQNNGTAVLLERVPTDVTLIFSGSLFTGNGQDIDNRCGQALDLDGAVFQ